MAGRKSDFTLPTNTLDELFSTQEERDDAKLSKIRDIPLELIDDFPDHPFKVRDDEDMIQLVESVKERGVITPATVRQKEDGRYELISGHRRKRACELARFEVLRCEVVDLDRDAATVLMVESNYQRSQILPSEKAFAYKMRLEAMNRQAGRPRKENPTPVVSDLDGQRTNEILGNEVGESREQIRRYIRLTSLDDGNRAENEAIKDKFNEKLGVSKAQEQAMLAGSMIRWDSIAAKPKSYDENGKAIKPKDYER